MTEGFESALANAQPVIWIPENRLLMHRADDISDRSALSGLYIRQSLTLETLA